MITGYDSYKLSVNNTNTINADTIQTKNFNADTDGNIYGTNLYINNQLINFASYITSSYLTSQLSNYVLTSSLNSTLNNYVLTTTLNSTLSNYATYGALGSYRLISDSWSRGDTTNEIQIRTGYTTDLNGNIQTCKSVDDSIITDLALTNTNVAVLDASMAVANTNITALNASVASLDAQVGTLETKTMYQSTGTGLSGAYTQFINNLNVSNGLSNAIQLKNTGEAVVSTLTTDYIQPNSTTISISGNNINIGGLTSVIYINGLPYSSFNQLSFFNQW